MAFQIIRDDITKVAADAIVNSANPDPIYGRGVDAAIYHAAGENLLLKEREKIGELSTGEVVATPAFALPAKYIIHTVGPVWAGGESGELLALAACYRNALELAEKLECESIAFPMISTGVYGFPKERALQTALAVIRDFLQTSDMEVYLVVYSKGTFQIPSEIKRQVSLYIDNKTPDLPEMAKASAPDNMLQMPSLSDAGMPMRKESGRRRRRVRRDADTVYESAIREETYPDVVSESPSLLPDATGGFSGAGLQERVEHIGDTFQQCLLHWIDEKDMTDVDVYKKANLDRKLFSKIRCNVQYMPKKQTAIALAIALELTLDETKDLLRRAGLAFSPSSVSDLIIEYCIENHLYDIYEINSILFDYDQPTLGC